MAVTHASLGLAAMIFLAGSLVMLFFVILSGATTTTPLDRTYFLQADTAGIAGAQSVSQWTYFYVCGAGNTQCGVAHPALPLGFAWASGGAGAPAQLVGGYGNGTTSHYYWYMWRFGWVFYLLSLLFEVVAFFTGFLACFGRLGSAVSGLVALTALFFYTIAVSLMTATFVKMRDAFHANGRAASIGEYAFGFSWGAWGALLIATVLFFMGMLGGRGRGSDGVVPAGRGRGRGGGWMRRRKSTRSRSSYDMGQRRVKDNYS